MATPTYLLSVFHPSLKKEWGGTLKLSDLFLVPQLKIYRVLCLQQDLYLSVDIKFLTAEPALDLYELLGGFLS